MADIEAMPGTAKDRGARSRRVIILLCALLAAAFVVRLGFRLLLGEQSYFVLGYTSFYELAEHLVLTGDVCAQGACPRPPLYPLFLVPAVLAGKNWLFIIVPQALIGAGTALVAFLIGSTLFGAREGLIAAAAVAFYPYYVAHDTALQDTSLATFALALAVWLTLRAARLCRTGDWIIAGLALGAVMLARAALAPTVAVTLLWIAGATPGGWRDGLRAAAIAAAAAIAMLSPWLVHTARVAGAPALSTDTGYELWVGNNPYTFSRFPQASIDDSSRLARAQFTEAERHALRTSADNPRAWNGWFGMRARAYIAAEQRQAVARALRKIAIALSWRITPYRDGAAQFAYGASYLTLALLGTTGMIMTGWRRETWLMGLMLAAFFGVTAVFSAQTSHRVYLDVYWAVYAAAAATALWDPLRQRGPPLAAGRIT